MGAGMCYSWVPSPSFQDQGSFPEVLSKTVVYGRLPSHLIPAWKFSIQGSVHSRFHLSAGTVPTQCLHRSKCGFNLWHQWKPIPVSGLPVGSPEPLVSLHCPLVPCLPNPSQKGLCFPVPPNSTAPQVWICMVLCRKPAPWKSPSEAVFKASDQVEVVRSLCFGFARVIIYKINSEID